MKKGFIALISSIVISSALALIVFSTSLSGFTFRFNSLNSEFKAQSKILAESCLETLVLKLSGDNSYKGGEEITIGDKKCFICKTQNTEVFKITSAVFRFETNLEASIDEELRISEVKEVVSHDDCIIK